MSKKLLESFFRPFICRDCRARLATSPPKLRRTIVDLPKGQQVINNAEAVERRVQALGGKDELAKLYTHFPLRNHERMLSPNAFSEEYKRQWERMPAEKRQKQEIAVYGRVMSLRRHGRKLAFIDLEVGGETASKGTAAQAMLNLASLTSDGKPLPDDAIKNLFTKLQRGDWIGVRGRAEMNDNGQFIIRASELPTYLAPALQSVPLEVHDPEFSMRNRHAHQIVDPSQRDIIFLRAKLLRKFRSFMAEQNFIEVNTPLIVSEASGAAARPFETDATEFSDMTLNLRIAPELFLKRMIVGGMQRVFEIGPAFRNEGVDNTHNPEFTIAEFYGVMLRLEDLMKMTEELFRSLSYYTTKEAENLESTSKPEIDFSSPYRVIRFIPGLGDAIREHIDNWRFPELDHPNAIVYLQRTYRHFEMKLPLEPTIPRLLDGLASRFLEPPCQNPTFIIGQPECMAPLAKSSLELSPTEGEDVYHRVSTRAELFIQGREFVNCYEEENSPIEQRRKFEEQISQHYNAESPQAIDESYLSALEWGMPPTGGWGCGFDRIVMLFGGKSRIADVLPFGNLRNVVGLGSQVARERRTLKDAERAKRREKHELNVARAMVRKERGRDKAESKTEISSKIGDAGEDTGEDTPSYQQLRTAVEVKKIKSFNANDIDWLADAVPDPEPEEDEDDAEGARLSGGDRKTQKPRGTILSGTASFSDFKSGDSKDSA